MSGLLTWPGNGSGVVFRDDGTAVVTLVLDAEDAAWYSATTAPRVQREGGRMADALMALLGAEVRRRIGEAGMSQADLAAMLGCSEKHLSRALSGVSGSVRFFDRIAEALGFSWQPVLMGEWGTCAMSACRLGPRHRSLHDVRPPRPGAEGGGERG